MKLNKKFFGILLSFSFFLFLGMNVSAMESKENFKTSIEYVVKEKEEIKNQIKAYFKVRFILKKFDLFDDEAKEMALSRVCVMKMEDPLKIMKEIMDRILQKKIYTNEDRKNIIEKIEKCLTNRSFLNLEITNNLFIELRDEIKKYMVNKINRISDAIVKAKRDFEMGDEVLIKREVEDLKDHIKYLDNIIKTKGDILTDFKLDQIKDNKNFFEKDLDEVKKQTAYSDKKKEAYKESVADMEEALERFNIFLAKVESLEYDDFKF